MNFDNLCKLEYIHSSECLRKLIIDNPGLPIYFVANDEGCLGDGVDTILGNVDCYKTKVFTAHTPWESNCDDYEKFYDDRIEFSEDLEDYLMDNNIDNCSEMSDEDFSKYVDEQIKSLDKYWEEVICIRGF